MATIAEIDPDGHVAKTVRRVLSRACKRRKRDELRRAYLDLAVDAQTTILFLDARLKHGPFLPDQAAAYTEACKCRDATFAALGVKPAGFVVNCPVVAYE